MIYNFFSLVLEGKNKNSYLKGKTRRERGKIYTKTLEKK